jgi:hypothetical protein
LEGSFRVEPHPFLKVGERVRVTRGTLEGVEGILVRKKNLYRLILSVDMLARSVAVEIDACDVQPAGPRELAGAFANAQYSRGGQFQDLLQLAEPGQTRVADDAAGMA